LGESWRVEKLREMRDVEKKKGIAESCSKKCLKSNY